MLQIATATKQEIALASESKHIIIVGPAYPLRGGLASYNQLLAEKLKQAGHRVSILTFSLQYPKIFFPGKTQYASEPAPDGLEITVGLNSVNPLNWIKWGRRLRIARPDLVIFRYWMPFMAPCLGSIARLIRKNGHSKIVAITDNVIPHEKKWFDTPLTRYFLNSCDGFVSMSRAVLEDLKAFGVHKGAKFNPHPMYENFGRALNKSVARAALGLDQEGHYLLFFGFIRKYKGLDLLLEAMADPRLKALDVRLIIAGEYYEDRAPYEKLMNRLDLHSRLVDRTHFIPDSKVRDYFCAADMVVQTYRSATQSGVTQVAYYYDRPMLVTDVGGLAELVPHEKVGYVCGVDAQQIADAIHDFYTSDREASFSAAVAEEKQRFSWESMIDSLFEVVNL